MKTSSLIKPAGILAIGLALTALFPVTNASAGGGCTITGTPGDDRLAGTDGPDVICARGGNDRIRGLGGRDVIRGGDGNDDLFGHAGADVLIGGPGSDFLVAGRGKDVILSGGNTIYPPEIERVLLEHPDVARAAVVGLPDALLGEMIVAAVEPLAGGTIDVDALASWLAGRVAPYQRPRRIVVMELPTSADLKVKRRLVAELLRAG